MEKRGIIELHFNWIFVLIAGAIIFAFFISIVNKQRELSEIKTSGSIVTNLDSILTGAQISTNTINIIDMPKVDIGFECDRYFIGPAPRQTKGNVIFSPSLLKGKQIVTWALDWNMPYRITNFLYLTDPQLRYIIVNNSKNLGKKLYDELPDEMNKELVDINQLANLNDKNNYKVRFIFLGNVNLNNSFINGLKNLNSMPDEDVTAINLPELKDSSIIPSTGTVIFLKKDETKWEQEQKTYYLKEESLFGAIFAANLDMYDCVMKKAFKKINLVTKIYLERSENLENYYFNLNNPCFKYHSSAKNELGNVEALSAEEIDYFPNPINGLARMNALATYSSNIKDENQKAQLFSCALIY